MTTSSVSALLDQAMRALSQGRPQAAEPLLRDILQRAPGSPPALAGLGQIAAQGRRWAEAEAAFRGSLAGDAAQPRVWFAQAQVLEVLGRPGDAAQSFAQAADRQPGWAAPRYQLARLLRELGRPADALGVAQQAVGLAPQDVDALQLLAMLQEELGQLPAAATTLAAALARAPQRAALHHNLGVVLHRQGRHAQALAAHQQALALGLDVAEAHYNTANTLQALERADDALAAYRRALTRAPQHALSLYDLARLRWTLGHADFDAELLAAQAQAPESDVAPGLRGLLLLKAGRAEAALQAYELAARRAPQRAAHADGQGQALSLLGRHDEARLAHRRAVALAPQDAAVLSNAARSLYAGGHIDEGLALAAQAHGLAPHDQLAIALLGLGWRLTGDARDAWLHDLDELVGVIELPPPPGWADIASFNAALALELGRLHTDREAPIDQTLREGTQTRGHLFDLDLPLVQALRGQIAEAISAWLASRRTDAAHPLLGRRTDAWRFAGSWSSRLRRSGFHTNHIHGQGWLSSCYYVATPASALASATHEGWIKFGEPDLPEPLRSQLPPARFEAPRPGRLLLFPSYLWHGTVPFDDEAHRLTVAFDVLPD
jgi:tetratricopeptide (TPR) repeat protein